MPRGTDGRVVLSTTGLDRLVIAVHPRSIAIAFHRSTRSRASSSSFNRTSSIAL
jgi:hypothetical protein